MKGLIYATTIAILLSLSANAQNPPMGMTVGSTTDGNVLFEATGNVTWMKSYDTDSNVTHSVLQRAGILYGEEDEVEAFKTIVFREGRLWSWGTLALGTGSVIQGEKGDNTIWTLFAAELAAHPIDTKLRCGIGAERIMKAGQDDTFLYVRIDFKP